MKKRLTILAALILIGISLTSLWKHLVGSSNRYDATAYHALGSILCEEASKVLKGGDMLW